MRRQATALRSGPIVGRAMTALVLLASFTLSAPVAAQAQLADWMRDVFGGSPPGTSQQSRPQPSRAERAAEPLADLRSGPVPLRSEEMLANLQRAIERYTEIARRGGWQPIPGTRMIRPGDDDERVPALRRRLIATGELRRAGGYETFSFDNELEAAVRRFQLRHGLRVSGRVDQPTLQALNVPVQARVAQLKVNYNRINELMGQRLDDRYVVVNVPGFQLEAVERGTVELRHRVIAGKPDRQTPTVQAQIRALNFFPFWRVPESVANLDLIPRLRKEPDYLQKEHIRILTGSFNGPEIDAQTINWDQIDPKQIRFRQDPGPQNALGLVRLDMPNEHGVYMHDTPMKPLFAQRARAFSAGCVRVQDVFELAAWVARGEPGMDRRRVDEIVSSGTAADIVLQRPVPVYFTYITAWAEADGSIEFRPDIYGRDGLRELSGDRERDPEAAPVPQTLAP